MALEDGISYLRIIEDTEVTHGVDGWYLDDMTWYPEDGLAVFQYERTIPGVGLELAIVKRPQPTTFKHPGWWGRNRTQETLKLTEKDWLRWERGIDLNPDEEYDPN
jgi:hypothetical protein